MDVRRKLEKIERALSRERVYTLEDFGEIEELPDETEILFDWGEVFRAVRRARGLTEPREGTYVRPTRAREVKAFFGFLSKLEG